MFRTIGIYARIAAACIVFAVVMLIDPPLDEETYVPPELQPYQPKQRSKWLPFVLLASLLCTIPVHADEPEPQYVEIDGMQYQVIDPHKPIDAQLYGIGDNPSSETSKKSLDDYATPTATPTPVSIVTNTVKTAPDVTPQTAAEKRRQRRAERRFIAAQVLDTVTTFMVREISPGPTVVLKFLGPVGWVVAKGIVTYTTIRQSRKRHMSLKTPTIVTGAAGIWNLGQKVIH